MENDLLPAYLTGVDARRKITLYATCGPHGVIPEANVIKTIHIFVDESNENLERRKTVRSTVDVTGGTEREVG